MQNFHQVRNPGQAQVILPQNLRLGKHRFRRSAADDSPAAEQVNLVAAKRNQIHIVSRQQQGHPQAFPQLIQQAQNVADSLRVQTGCRLVQNHHFRFHDQHTGNCHPFFLPIGQRMGRFLP